MKKILFLCFIILGVILLAFLTLTITGSLFDQSFIINSLLLVIWLTAVILIHHVLILLKHIFAPKNFYLLGYLYVIAQGLIIIAFGFYRLATAPNDLVVKLYYSGLLLFLIGLLIYLIIRAIWVYEGKKPY